MGSMGITFLLVFGLICTIDGQFEDLTGCIESPEFAPSVVAAFLAKFKRIDLLGQEASQSRSYESQAFYRIGQMPDQPIYLKYLSDMKSKLRVLRDKDDTTIFGRIKQIFLESNAEKAMESNAAKTLEELMDQLREKQIHPELLQLLRPVLSEFEILRNSKFWIQDVLKSEPNTETSPNHVELLQDNSEEINRILTCLKNEDEATIENGLTWLRCLFRCEDLPLISSALIDAFHSIPPCSRVLWFSDLILRLFVDYMGLETCFFQIISPDGNSTVMLIEGENTEVIEFKNYLPPGVRCFPVGTTDGLVREVIGLVFNTSAPCVVQIQMSTSNYMHDILPYIRRNDLSVGRPKCRNEGRSINQIAIGWHENAVNSSCVIVLNSTNWNSTFMIPLTATIDHKNEVDPFMDINFTLKLIVDDNIQNTTKLSTEVYDRDVDAICQSVNDPHISTFDNLYYNNLYQGYFQLYKHTTLEYEVQVIYQTCGPSVPNGESCNCGVAVRSGDDVFVVDRCRLKPEFCSEVDCHVMKVTLYVNGELTPGTRIFQMDGGLSYEVVLPHGTLVKIKSNGEELINVYIVPSPYDYNRTLGLCGTLNSISNDDLTLPNGTVMDATNVTTMQPREFIEAWRVNPKDQIFNGALQNTESFLTTNNCHCSHNLTSGVQCQCGYGELVEICDLSLDNEFTSENITSILKHSRRANNESISDFRDINDTLVPNDPQGLPSEAAEHCTSLLKCSTTPLLESCKLKGGSNCRSPQVEFHPAIHNAYSGCLDDYKITNSSSTIEWKMSATNAAKVGCLSWFQRKTDTYQRVMARFENDTCVNECFYRGSCINGKCQCNEGFMGADCSQLTLSGAPILLTAKSGLCDLRYEDCAFATIYGKNFTDDRSITCTATQIKVLDTENVPSSVKPIDVGIVFINPNQVICRLPYPGSYKIFVKHNGVTLSPPTMKQYGTEMTFMAYDSVCYACDTTTDSCQRKQDKSYCLVDNICYAHLQVHPSDNCKYCNVSYSVDHIYDSHDPDCVQKRAEEEQRKADEKKNQDIRIIVACVLSAIIIILSVVAFILSWKTEKQLNFSTEEDASTEAKPTDLNAEFSNTDDSSESSNAQGKKTAEPTNNNFLSPYSNDIPPEDDYEDIVEEMKSDSNPISTDPPEVLVIRNREVARVMAAEMGVASLGINNTQKNRTSSIVTKDQGSPATVRKASDTGSIKSFGIGAGGPITYGRAITSDQQGIGAHGMSVSSGTKGHSILISEKL